MWKRSHALHDPSLFFIGCLGEYVYQLFVSKWFSKNGTGFHEKKMR
jgi:hypothetical protein